MHYLNWKECYRTVTNLYLDYKNPRIPSNGENLSQRQLVEELVIHEKIYDLAKNIVERGYFPVESLVVIKENQILFKNKIIIQQ